MGLATLLGGRPRGFFIPHRHADQVRPCAYPALEALFAACWPAFERVLVEIDALAPELRRLGGPPPAPRFDQDWFPALDAAAAYAMVCGLRPRRIVEVGSGHSTRFLARAIADRELATTLLCIDPEPRATLAGLPLRWLETTLQQAPESCFTDLGAGDLLFVDSSHILMPGTRRRLAAEPDPPDACAGRIGPCPRRLPARPLSAGLGMARLQRAAGDRGAAPGRRLCDPLREPLRRCRAGPSAWPRACSRSCRRASRGSRAASGSKKRVGRRRPAGERQAVQAASGGVRSITSKASWRTWLRRISWRSRSSLTMPRSTHSRSRPKNRFSACCRDGAGSGRAARSRRTAGAARASASRSAGTAGSAPPG